MAGLSTRRFSTFVLTQQAPNLLRDFGLRASGDRDRLILRRKSRYLVFGRAVLLTKHRQGPILKQHRLKLNLRQDPEGRDRLPDLPEPSDRGLHRPHPQPRPDQTHGPGVGLAPLMDEEVRKRGGEDDLQGYLGLLDQTIEGRVIMLILLNTQCRISVLGERLGLLSEVDQLLLYLLLVEGPAWDGQGAVQEVAFG